MKIESDTYLYLAIACIAFGAGWMGALCILLHLTEGKPFGTSKRKTRKRRR